MGRNLTKLRKGNRRNNGRNRRRGRGKKIITCPKGKRGKLCNKLRKVCKRKFNRICLKRVQQQECPYDERPCTRKVTQAFKRLKRQSKRRGRPNRRRRNRRGRLNRRRRNRRGRQNRRRRNRRGRPNRRRRNRRGRNRRRSKKAKCARGKRGHYCRQVKKHCPGGSLRCMPKLTKKLCKRNNARRCNRRRGRGKKRITCPKGKRGKLCNKLRKVCKRK